MPDRWVTMNNPDWPGGPIRILILDVDGTMTDGGMYYSAEGLALKRFDVKDGGQSDMPEQQGSIALTPPTASRTCGQRLRALIPQRHGEGGVATSPVFPSSHATTATPGCLRSDGATAEREFFCGGATEIDSPQCRA